MNITYAETFSLNAVFRSLRGYTQDRQATSLSAKARIIELKAAPFRIRDDDHLNGVRRMSLEYTAKELISINANSVRSRVAKHQIQNISHPFVVDGFYRCRKPGLQKGI